LAAHLATATVLSIPTSKYDPQLAKELSDRALAIAREIKDRGAEAHILRNLMLIARWTQDPADAARYGEESLAIARERNLREEMAFTLNDLAVHGYLDAGQLDGRCLRGHSLGKTIGNLWGQSYARWIVGNVYSDRGEPERATQIMEDCIRFGEQAGFAGAEVGVRNMLAMVAAECGMFDRGVEIARKAAAVAERRFAAWGPWSQGVLARLYTRTGKIAEAESAVDRALSSPVEYHIGRGMAQVSFQLTLAKADIALAKDDLDYSTSALEVLIQYLHRANIRTLQPEALFTKGKVDLARGQKEAAQESFTQARDVAELLGIRRMLWKIYIALAEIQTALGNELEARALGAKARGVVEYIAAHATEEQRTTFLNLPDVRVILYTE
jgi:tetratricopeptide (TPR) repeat protein